MSLECRIRPAAPIRILRAFIRDHLPRRVPPPRDDMTSLESLGGFLQSERRASRAARTRSNSAATCANYERDREVGDTGIARGWRTSSGKPAAKRSAASTGIRCSTASSTTAAVRSAVTASTPRCSATCSVMLLDVPHCAECAAHACKIALRSGDSASLNSRTSFSPSRSETEHITAESASAPVACAGSDVCCSMSRAISTSPLSSASSASLEEGSISAT